MTKFYFSAGEQVTSAESRNVLDAWMTIANRARRQPLAREFREMPIQAFDENGTLIETRRWSGWEEAVLRDTYGDNFRAILDHAAELV